MEAQVRAAVERYVTAVSKKDLDLLRSAFREDAVLFGYLNDNFLSIPVAAFIDIVGTTPEPAAWISGYSAEIRSIEVTEKVAVAVLEEKGYLGADFTNYFSLVYQDGNWAIASKTFYLTKGSLPL